MPHGRKRTKTPIEIKELRSIQLGSGERRMDDSRLALGLTPVRTMVEPFVRVASYETYRLCNRSWELSRRESIEMYYLKQQVDWLHPTLECFDGAQPMRLISFLTTLRDTLHKLGTSEAAAMRDFAYFLGGKPRTYTQSSST